jgi:diketogulonate reductase-like aldo/keto reductase
MGAWMTAMASADKAGKIRAVGISKRNVAQMRSAADVLGHYDVPLVSK